MPEANSVTAPDANVLNVHRGATDLTNITIEAPSEVMARVKKVLVEMGVAVHEESTYRYRCSIGVTRRRSVSQADSTAEDTQAGADSLPTDSGVVSSSLPKDPVEEVRFSVELTNVPGLTQTYSLDIRRLKGNLNHYKVVYDTFREKAKLNEPKKNPTEGHLK